MAMERGGKMKDIELVLGCVAGIFILFGGILTGYKTTNKQWQKEAVELGHAEYITDNYGNSKWQWKETE